MEMKEVHRLALVLSLTVFAASSSLAQEVPKLSSDLHEISNIKLIRSTFALSKAHFDALKRNWFFSSPAQEFLPFDVYGRNDYLYVPSLVTTDNVLELLHEFFDSTLQVTETTKLSPGARKLSASLLATAVKDWKAATGSPLRSVAAKNVAYFGIADRLGGGKAPIPSAIQPMVAATMTLILNHQGYDLCPLFPYKIDFSQFVPRGHYTKSVVLRRYFQTMMWFGLTPLAAPKNPGDSLEPIQQALLLSHELTHSDQLARWNRMYDVTSILMGPSNELTPIECEALAKTVFGPKPSLADWSDKTKIRAFVSELGKARAPVFSADLNSASSPGKIQVRFMGQRGSADSYVLQSLANRMRLYPSPLDVMAVLGSASALRILNASPAEYNPENWADYVPRRARLTAEFAAYAPARWSSDAYWSWLDCLRKIVAPPERSGQPFMSTPAWSDRCLYTALASWARMRHDTILYGQQPSVAEQGEDGEERPPNRAKGFVEPNLSFYIRMAAMLSSMKTELAKRGYLASDLAKQYDDLSELLHFFITVSKKELSGKALTGSEYQRIRGIEGNLEDLYNSMVVLGIDNYQVLTPDDDDPATVADFHTANDTVLEAGVGRADHLFAVVKIEGKLYVARGATLSYYEFRQPSSDRMTDHQWKDRLNANHLPPRPSWIRSFFVPHEVKDKPE
jgi:hypothetical protein